jgi:hypothetical protein
MLFTFVIEHGGSTTIEQVRGRSPSDAMARWNKISRLCPGLILDHMEMDPPTQVSGNENVWCATAVGKDDVFYLIYVIATLELGSTG